MFCTFYLKFSCRNDVSIAKALYLIVSDFARCKAKRTIAVVHVSCVTVPRTECEAACAVLLNYQLVIFIAKPTWIQLFFSYKRITVQFGFTIARVTTVKI